MPHDPSREAAPPGDATIDYLDERDPRADAYWRAILTGDIRPAPISRLGRAIFRHYGSAYVGIVGRAGQPTDFIALGDAVNVAERISSSAAAGELLVSDALAAQLPALPAGAAHRELRLKGVAEPVAAWSPRTAPAEPEPSR